jgi:hypothetical protein
MEKVSKYRNMMSILQGEKLLLLVRRDRRSAEEIAQAMDIDKSYLPKLYKMEILPPKPFKKAMEVFHVSESYFTENVEIVSEPSATYRRSGLPSTEEMAHLEEENEALRTEIARLRQMLEKEKNISANLSEALVNLSKRS